MTQQEFLIVASNFPNQVNVWYTATAPYTVVGLTVPTTNNAGEDIIQYLQQATVITVEVNEDTGEYVTLNITQRSLLGNAGAQYYFFNTSAGTIQDPGDGLIRPGQIIFTPGINGLGFQQGGYNATQGLADNDRESDYIMKADRISYISTGAGLPTNIALLGTNSATRAQVQDSLYSDTGWISGRYEGSKIDKLSNLGADPALQGTFFEGATFSLDADDSNIAQLASAGTLTYGQYFFSGVGTIPRYIRTATGYTISGGIISVGNQVLPLNGFTTPTILPAIGDRFAIKNVALFIDEVVQMIPPTSDTYYPYVFFQDSSTLTLRVKRGYNNTQQSVLSIGYSLYKITPIKVYTLQGTSIQAAKQGKLIVKGEEEVLYIDVNGFIIGGTNPVES